MNSDAFGTIAIITTLIHQPMGVRDLLVEVLQIKRKMTEEVREIRKEKGEQEKQSKWLGTKHDHYSLEL